MLIEMSMSLVLDVVFADVSIHHQNVLHLVNSILNVEKNKGSFKDSM